MTFRIYEFQNALFLLYEKFPIMIEYNNVRVYTEPTVISSAGNDDNVHAIARHVYAIMN